MGIPCFLGGMARGLLGRYSPIQARQKRGEALKEADVVIMAGMCQRQMSSSWQVGVTDRCIIMAGKITDRCCHNDREVLQAVDINGRYVYVTQANEKTNTLMCHRRKML